MQKSTFMAKSPNAEDCSSNQAIFLELKKRGEGMGMGQQRAIRELSQSLAALPEALCIEKRCVLMNGSFEGKKLKKSKIQHLEQKQNPQTYRRIFLEVYSFFKNKEDFKLFFRDLGEHRLLFFFLN